jgi:hypothetical protein
MGGSSSSWLFLIEESKGMPSCAFPEEQSREVQKALKRSRFHPNFIRFFRTRISPQIKKAAFKAAISTGRQPLIFTPLTDSWLNIYIIPI